MKNKILKIIEEYHKEQGVAFLSTEEAEEYFKGLVELIEDISSVNLIEKEIAWHEQDTTTTGLSEDYKKGFIDGMSHIKKIINR